jgi:hypothetical protein
MGAGGSKAGLLGRCRLVPVASRFHSSHPHAAKVIRRQPTTASKFTRGHSRSLSCALPELAPRFDRARFIALCRCLPSPTAHRACRHC